MQRRRKIRHQPYFDLFLRTPGTSEVGKEEALLGLPFILDLIQEERDLTPEDAPYRVSYFAYLDLLEEIVQIGPSIPTIGPDVGIGSDPRGETDTDIIGGLVGEDPGGTY